MDLPKHFVIRESSHRVLNPIESAQLATLGAALRLPAGGTLLDLACGKGELLCTWAREHGITGTGVDISTAFLADARARAADLGVADRVTFLHGDAGAYVAAEPADVVACIGATWIGGDTPGTVRLMESSLKLGGMLLVGDVYWRADPPPEAVEALFGADCLSLPGQVERFHELGYDVVELVAADERGWDRYAAASWLSMRRWLDANPDDELAPEIRSELTRSQLQHVRWQRPYLGWGVFALLRR
ncbi:SAM-dependent methyltransferase [Catenuloplanes nepalensis]|uniref:SAM-dependent methyltransferase n=1 Tax=Catenuloplanes nepalensis TaxID=587533 RepID=A0ABT9MZ79_9ACTN|nr:methyltransferase domain-containing protein [Catenuloplanes nepalensis]MDP9796742.1 SAM-dependent methyltransferase [Catenuloplanes nepalensis]